MSSHMKSGGSLSTMNVIGILALFCTMSEFAILTPSIAAFSHHFADTDITTIMLANSITGIVSVPVSIISGALLPKVGFKPAAIVGILIMTVGGAYPFLMPDITDYNLIIFSRVIVGIGLGIMFPVGNASIKASSDPVCSGWESPSSSSSTLSTRRSRATSPRLAGTTRSWRI